jgi:putative inorganic carbon (hco3(-)) transporter
MVVRNFYQRCAGFLVRWEWFWLLLLLPFLLFPNGPQALFLLVIPLLWLLRRPIDGYFVPPTPLNGVIALLLFMVLVSLYATFDIELSMPKIAGMVLGVAIFYGAVAYGRSRSNGLWHLVTAVLLIGFGMSLVGLVGTPWRGPFTFLNAWQSALPIDMAIPGTVTGTINPNEMAGVLNWLLPLAVALLFGGLGRLRRSRLLWPWLLLGGLVALWSMMLLATYSRGGTAAFVVSLLVMVAVAWRWGRVLLATAVVTLTTLAYRYNLLELLLGNGLDTRQQMGLEARVEIWSRALYGLQDFPFTGMSMNGFREVVHILYPLFLIPPTTDLGHAHNHLLQAGLDLGIPGLIAYLAIWLISAILLYQAWQQAHLYSHKLLIIGLIGSLTAGWFFGILDAIALGARPGFLWWLLLALVVLVHEKVIVTSGRWKVESGNC